MRFRFIQILVALIAVLSASPVLIAAQDLDVITGGGKTPAPFAMRHQAIRRLGSNLSVDDIRRLYAFLERRSCDDALMPESLAALKNDVVNILMSQLVLPAELPGRMIAMFKDTTHDEVWRDYCVQHLGSIYKLVRDEADKKAISDVFWLGADMKTGSIPGTALIALMNNSREPGCGENKLAEKVFQILADGSFSDAARITAFQVGAQLQLKNVVPMARQWAAGGSMPVRASAIACVGVLGDRTDVEWLKPLVASSDLRIRTAAQVAMGKLSRAR